MKKGGRPKKNSNEVQQSNSMQVHAKNIMVKQKDDKKYKEKMSMQNKIKTKSSHYFHISHE